MNLGFYYHIPAVEENGKIIMPGYLGRFLDVLAKDFGGVVLFQHLPNPGENVHFDYTIQSSNVSLISLPARGSVPFRLLHGRKFTRIFEQNRNNLDALLIRGPSPLLPSFIRVTKNLPTILLIVGDYLAGIASLPQPWWRKELIRIWSIYNYWGQLRLADRSLLLVNSRELYRKFKNRNLNVKEIRTTTLTTKDFHYRDDTCQSKPIRLLYTGRLDPAKGLLEIVDALAILVHQGIDIVFDLVGWPENGTNIINRINKIAEEKSISDRIFYHGYKSVGPELFEFYKKADIFIIASKDSEGFPRTIWEAMAHSLPVVATKVGSIPYYLKHEKNALLVKPKSPRDLAEAIRRIISDQNLRKSILKNGYQVAQNNTLEIRSKELIENINLYVDRWHSNSK